MRIFGHDVCQQCGYEMTGHNGSDGKDRTCPECGVIVPPVETPNRGWQGDDPAKAA